MNPAGGPLLKYGARLRQIRIDGTHPNYEDIIFHVFLYTLRLIVDRVPYIWNSSRCIWTKSLKNY